MNSLTSQSTKITSKIIAAAASALIFGVTAFAGTANPYSMSDGSWITLSGEVKSVSADTFTLEYRDGFVTVEMDDGDRDADAYKLIAGDDVTVTGKIDDDLFETTTIEASAVFVKNLDTTFFASAVDEEDRNLVATYVTMPLNNTFAVIEGRVAKVNGDEFVLDTGPSKLRVDVDDMPYDPLDDEGYQKISVGDDVKVTGRLDRTLFDGLELEADSIITLSSKKAEEDNNKTAMNQ